MPLTPEPGTGHVPPKTAYFGPSSTDPCAASPAVAPAEGAGWAPVALPMGASAAGPRGGASPSNAAPPLRVVFLGPPNAGKGTQAAMLREKLGVPGITTGDLLRREAAAGGAPGLWGQGIMQVGGAGAGG